MNKYKIINPIIGISLFSCGYLLSKIQTNKNQKFEGALRIDNSEPDEPPKIFLELTNDKIIYSNVKTIQLKVIRKNYI